MHICIFFELKNKKKCLKYQLKLARTLATLAVRGSLRLLACKHFTEVGSAHVPRSSIVEGGGTKHTEGNTDKEIYFIDV